MDVSVTEKKPTQVKFTVSGINEDIANALRRTVISDIPTLAVEEVTFYANSSVMDDEMIAHRLGLVPLKTEAKSLDKVTLTLKTEGPRTVYAGDMLLATTGKSGKSESLAAYPKIILTKLTEGQKLEIEMSAELNTGEEHAKWQAGNAGYNKNDKGAFDFIIETYGQYDIKDLVEQSFKIVEDRIKQLKEALE